MNISILHTYVWRFASCYALQKGTKAQSRPAKQRRQICRLMNLSHIYVLSLVYVLHAFPASSSTHKCAQAPGITEVISAIPRLTLPSNKTQSVSTYFAQMCASS